MQFNCQNTIRPGEKKRLNYAYMLKNGVGRYNIFFFFFFYAKLGQQPKIDILGWGMDVGDFFFGRKDCLKT
jgi:hypothetical protein